MALTIAEIWAKNLQPLQKFRQEIERRLQDIVDKNFPEDLPVYVLKGRIKDYESLVGKLDRRVRSGDIPEDRRARRLEDLFEMCGGDLVGVRLVLLMPGDVDRARQIFSHLASGTGLDLGRWEVIRFVREKIQRKDSGDLGGPDLQLRDSGYSSVHVKAGLSGEPTYQGFVAELQLRTLLEEAWAEPSHRLVYKGVQTPYSKRLFKLLKEQLVAADGLLQVIAEDAWEERFARQATCNLQVSKSYSFHGDGLNDSQLERLARAKEHRDGGEHERARDVHRTLADELLESGKQELAGALAFEQAIDILSVGGEEHLQRAAEIYKSFSTTSLPLNFWSRFRLSFIYHEQHKPEEALEDAEASVRILETKGGEIEGFDCRGLYADALIWLGVLYWHEYLRTPREQEERSKRLRLASLEQTRRAVGQLDREDAGTRGLWDRAHNNLAFYTIEHRNPVSLVESEQHLRECHALRGELRDLRPSIEILSLLSTKARLRLHQGLQAHADGDEASWQACLSEARETIGRAWEMLAGLYPRKPVPRWVREDVESMALLVQRNQTGPSYHEGEEHGARLGLSSRYPPSV